MLTRRKAFGLLAMTPAAFSPSLRAATCVLAYSDLQSAENFAIAASVLPPNREVTIELSQGLLQHAWTYAGQHYDQRSASLQLHEDELVRMNLLNDTMTPQTLSLDGMSFEVPSAFSSPAPHKRKLSIAPGERISINIFAASLVGGTLRNETSFESCPIRIQPSYQSHPSVEA